LPLFFTIQFILSLLKFKEVMLPPIVISILTSLIDALEMNAIPKDEIQNFLMPGDSGKEMFESSGNLLLLIPLVLGMVLTIILLGYCCKRVTCCINLIDKIKNTLFWNLIIGA
jgi:hypothetical protein